MHRHNEDGDEELDGDRAARRVLETEREIVESEVSPRRDAMPSPVYAPNQGMAISGPGPASSPSGYDFDDDETASQVSEHSLYDPAVYKVGRFWRGVLWGRRRCGVVQTETDAPVIFSPPRAPR